MHDLRCKVANNFSDRKVFIAQSSEFCAKCALYWSETLQISYYLRDIHLLLTATSTLKTFMHNISHRLTNIIYYICHRICLSL